MTATQLQFRRGNTAQHLTFTGAVAEVTVDTDKKVVVVHDGVNAGGTPLSTQAFTQAAYDAANSASSSGSTNLTYIQGVNTAQNTNISAVDTYATSAYGKANTGVTLAQAAYDAANNVTPQIQPSFNKANAAYDQANTATVLAQAAFDTANTKFSSSGGSITGDTNITGNLTVTGTTFYANTVNMSVEDNIITLNSNVTGAPTLSAGIEVNRGSSTNTKILWSEANTSWEFTNNGTSYDKIAGQTYTNAAFTQANTGTTLAQAAFDKANTAPKTTTAATAPVSPSVGDMWYDTDNDVLLRYTNDGTSNNWIDITGPIFRSTYIRPTYLISANVS